MTFTMSTTPQPQTGNQTGQPIQTFCKQVTDQCNPNLLIPSGTMIFCRSNAHGLLLFPEIIVGFNSSMFPALIITNTSDYNNTILSSHEPTFTFSKQKTMRPHNKQAENNDGHGHMADTTEHHVGREEKGKRSSHIEKRF